MIMEYLPHKASWIWVFFSKNLKMILDFKLEKIWHFCELIATKQAVFDLAKIWIFLKKNRLNRLVIYRNA